MSTKRSSRSCQEQPVVTRSRHEQPGAILREPNFGKASGVILGPFGPLAENRLTQAYTSVPHKILHNYPWRPVRFEKTLNCQAALIYNICLGIPLTKPRRSSTCRGRPEQVLQRRLHLHLPKQSFAQAVHRCGRGFAHCVTEHLERIG